MELLVLSGSELCMLALQSAEQLQQDSSLKVNEGLFVADITADEEGIAKAMQGADALIIATSAVPKMVGASSHLVCCAD